MQDKFSEKQRKLLRLLERDEEYMEIYRRRADSIIAFRTVWDDLDVAQQDSIMQFIGISEELFLRELELAISLE